MDINSAPWELNPEPSFVVIMSCSFFIHHLKTPHLLCLTLSAHLFANQVNNLLSNYIIVNVKTSQACDKLTACLVLGERCLINLLSIRSK